MSGRSISRRSILALFLVLPGLLSCSSIGPATVSRDRLDYTDALAEAAKREALLNMVKLRYSDVLSVITVNQLVAGYTLEGRVNLSSNFFRETFSFSDDLAFSLGGTFSDRPTVTYAPIKGDDFARTMLTPIAPSELFAMLAAGAPADLTLGLGVQSINGLRNWAVDSRGARADPAFAEVLDLIGELRSDGALGFRFDTQAGRRIAYLLLAEGEDQAQDPRVRRLVELLGLDPNVTSFPIRFGFGEGHGAEIRIYTGSLIEILSNLGAQIQVPPADVEDGRTYATQARPADLASLPSLSVNSGGLKPFDYFVAVEYRDTWYWIDDRDYTSKRIFSVLMLLLNLVDKTGAPQLPVITIPAG